MYISRHAQALAAVKPYTHWLSQFYNESANQPEHRQKFTELITTLLDALACHFEESVSSHQNNAKIVKYKL